MSAAVHIVKLFYVYLMNYNIFKLGNTCVFIQHYSRICSCLSQQVFLPICDVNSSDIIPVLYITICKPLPLRWLSKHTFDLISHKWKCLIVWKERLNRCDGQQYHQYQQMNNIISPQTGCITMDGVGNQGPGLRQTRKCGGVKPFNGILTPSCVN